MSFQFSEDTSYRALFTMPGAGDNRAVNEDSPVTASQQRKSSDNSKTKHKSRKRAHEGSPSEFVEMENMSGENQVSVTPAATAGEHVLSGAESDTVTEDDIVRREMLLGTKQRQIRIRKLEQAEEVLRLESLDVEDVDYELMYMADRYAQQVSQESNRQVTDMEPEEETRGRPVRVGHHRQPLPPGTEDDEETGSVYAESFLYGNEDEWENESQVSSIPAPRSGFKPTMKKAKLQGVIPKKPAATKKATAATATATEDVSTETTPNPEKVDNMKKWKAGGFARVAQKAVAEVEEDNLSPPVEEGLADFIRTMYKKTKDLAKGKTLSEEYTSPRNLKEILVPKMNREYFKSNKVPAEVKKADVELQLTQTLLLSALTAFLPLCEYLLEKGDEDPELDVIGAEVADGLRLAFYANTSLIRRRRNALGMNMDSDMAYPVAQADVGGEFLLGDGVQETVDEVKKSRKLYRDLAPEKERNFNRGRARGRQQRGARGGYNNTGYRNQGFQTPSPPNRGRGSGGYRARGQQNRGRQDGQQWSPLQNVHQNQDKQNFNKKR